MSEKVCFKTQTIKARLESLSSFKALIRPIYCIYMRIYYIRKRVKNCMKSPIKIPNYLKI